MSPNFGNKIIEVGIGQVKVGRKAILRADAIGSCIAVAAYDSKKRVGAMAHVMLAGSSP
ncbi:MAG: hypothetical protein HY747_10605 [Elusimicrobia bacterium]|nr:hypothetical protein [Elusimicrobiota bacterium]